MIISLRVCRREHRRDRQGSGERARQLGQSVIRHGPYIVLITFRSAKLHRGGKKEHLDWAQLPLSVQSVHSAL